MSSSQDVNNYILPNYTKQKHFRFNRFFKRLQTNHFQFIHMGAVSTLSTNGPYKTTQDALSAFSSSDSKTDALVALRLLQCVCMRVCIC